MDALLVLIGLTIVRLIFPVGLLFLVGEWARKQRRSTLQQR